MTDRVYWWCPKYLWWCKKKLKRFEYSLLQFSKPSLQWNLLDQSLCLYLVMWPVLNWQWCFFFDVKLQNIFVSRYKFIDLGPDLQTLLLNISKEWTVLLLVFVHRECYYWWYVLSFYVKGNFHLKIFLTCKIPIMKTYHCSEMFYGILRCAYHFFFLSWQGCN